jgi:hypothetical protein
LICELDRHFPNSGGLASVNNPILEIFRTTSMYHPRSRSGHDCYRHGFAHLVSVEDARLVNCAVVQLSVAAKKGTKMAAKWYPATGKPGLTNWKFAGLVSQAMFSLAGLKRPEETQKSFVIF